MSRTPAPIPPKARALWAAGDEQGASRLAKLKPRQLRNRLGPPGRGAAPSTAASAPDAPTTAPATQRLVQVAPRRTAVPSETTPVLPAVSVPTDKLTGLCELVARLPPAQQDAVAMALPLEARRREALAQALAPHPAAAAACAAALRKVAL